MITLFQPTSAVAGFQGTELQAIWKVYLDMQVEGGRVLPCILDHRFHSQQVPLVQICLRGPVKTET